MEVIKIKSPFDIPENFTGIAEYPNGDKYWYTNRKLHRENGPAIEWANGFKSWYKNGNAHREDGPAIENTSGVKQWWLDNYQYTLTSFKFLIQTSIYLKKEKGRYNLEWLLFLTDQDIKEFPFIPEMDFVKEYLDAVQ